ncbi:MAG: hypothetical protein GC154_00980 [bacterium]|nr:hypothetical protein [bacterium]
MIKLKRILGGLLSYTPLWNLRLNPNGGETLDPAYCYSTCLRHYTFAARHGIDEIPESVIEFGCGFSSGAGLSWMLLGARRLYALDACRFASLQRDEAILRELIDRFARRDVYDNNIAFPIDLLDEKTLSRSLNPARIESIHQALRLAHEEKQAQSNEIRIEYHAPRYDDAVIAEGGAQRIVSQAVMQHVEEYAKAYRLFYRWLTPGGVMTHHIDYSSFGVADEWNGHWTVSDQAFRLMQGRRPCLTNRAPHSWHLGAMREAGFEIIGEDRHYRASEIKRDALKPRFQSLSDDDLSTDYAIILARKPY